MIQTLFSPLRWAGFSPSFPSQCSFTILPLEEILSLPSQLGQWSFLRPNGCPPVPFFHRCRLDKPSPRWVGGLTNYTPPSFQENRRVFLASPWLELMHVFFFSGQWSSFGFFFNSKSLPSPFSSAPRPTPTTFPHYKNAFRLFSLLVLLTRATRNTLDLFSSGN